MGHYYLCVRGNYPLEGSGDVREIRVRREAEKLRKDGYTLSLVTTCPPSCGCGGTCPRNTSEMLETTAR